MLSDLDLWALYERSFRSLLWRLKTPRLEGQVQRLLNAGRKASALSDHPSALAGVYSHARRCVLRLLRRRGLLDDRSRRREGSRWRELSEICFPKLPFAAGPDFHCDAGLGGLAKWLRAAGYDAAWWPGIDDDVLLQKQQASSAILLTTDRLLMRRGVIARGLVPALLVPVALNKHEQFQFVRQALQLPRKSPRCMACGGPLQAVSKESMRERIPPKTLPWRDDYFVCGRCGKLYWQGTHWQRIERELAALPEGG